MELNGESSRGWLSSETASIDETVKKFRSILMFNVKSEEESYFCVFSPRNATNVKFGVEFFAFQLNQPKGDATR